LAQSDTRYPGFPVCIPLDHGFANKSDDQAEFRWRSLSDASRRGWSARKRLAPNVGNAAVGSRSHGGR
jgi:hypothetical protein